MTTPQYEIYAIKYAHHDRSSRDNFVGGDSHDVPMPLDYFVWAIRGNGRTWVLDTGFSAEVARQRRSERKLRVGRPVRPRVAQSVEPARDGVEHGHRQEEACEEDMDADDLLLHGRGW